MGSYRIVVDPPGVRERREEMLVEAFIAQLPVEGFNERTLQRLSRRDLMPFNASLFDPAQHSSSIARRPAIAKR
jgi:hypothetical protein